jgi:predicted Zn-dependent peptidase
MPRVTTLDNGARVVSHYVPDAHSVALVLSVDVGARHETPEENGLSHLLEHMAFKGTPEMNAQDIAEAFDRMGGQVNAYTSHEHTVYYAKVLKEYGEEALRLLCDMVVRATLDDEELTREKEVVLQEMAMHEDTPDDVVVDMFQRAIFPNQPLGHSILGKAEQLAAYTRADVAAYVAKHYTPNRMVVASCGALPHDRVQAVTAAAIHGSTQQSAAPSPALYRTALHVQEKALEQVQLMLGVPACSVQDADYYPMQVFSMLLGGGMSSRLFQEVREKRGLAYTISSYLAAYNDCGVLSIYAGTSAEQLPALMQAVQQVLDSIQAGVSADECLRAKNQLKANVVMAQESHATTAEWMARHMQIHGHVRSAEEILAAIDAVTPDTMIALAMRYLADVPLSVAALGPVNEAMFRQSFAPQAA